VPLAILGSPNPLPNLSTVALRTRRTTLSPKRFILLRESPSWPTEHWSGPEADLAGQPELGGDGRRRDDFSYWGADGRTVRSAGPVAACGDGKARPAALTQFAGLPRTCVAAEIADAKATGRSPLVAAIS